MDTNESALLGPPRKLVYGLAAFALLISLACLAAYAAVGDVKSGDLDQKNLSPPGAAPDPPEDSCAEKENSTEEEALTMTSHRRGITFRPSRKRKQSKNLNKNQKKY